MCNHVHLLVEVAPSPVDGLTDEQLLARVRAIASQADVALLRKELKESRENLAAGLVGVDAVAAPLFVRRGGDWSAVVCG